ncbi:DUF1016 domain-containing protein [Candidatus Poribacteria bacterium]|nr:DUF1016 domain-containing protein [Candidatus Poribacteria bacterium]
MNYSELVEAIGYIHKNAQYHAVQAVNTSITIQNWLIGYYIVEYEQQGSDRAQYGEKLLQQLSEDLTQRLGRGFSERNLRLFRQFYRTYSIWQSVIAKSQADSPMLSPGLNTHVNITPEQEKLSQNLLQKVTWTHFIELIRIDDPLKRSFYEVETLKNRWSVRELKRQIDSLLFERIGLSRAKEEVLELAKRGEIVTTPEEMIRDPYVFEFLGLKEKLVVTEQQLESALLDHLQDFLIEMGKGFCFAARQKRVTINNQHYYIDLVLFNRKLKCLVLIDLKMGEFTHQDAGQMNFYLNYAKAEEMEEGENPPVGIILCASKDETHVEYALGGMDNHLFVSRYLLELPTKEQLEAFVQREKRVLEQQLNAK